MTEYVIHSVARGRHNRSSRAALPQNPRMKQYVGSGQQRLVRGRPITISEESLLQNLEEIQRKHAGHVLEVRTRDGRLVDLATLSVQPAGPAEPRPHPAQDSLANDKNFTLPPGFRFVPPRHGDDATMPVLVPEGEKPALLREVEEAEAVEEKLADVDPTQEPALDSAVQPDHDLDAVLTAAQASAVEDQDTKE